MLICSRRQGDEVVVGEDGRQGITLREAFMLEEEILDALGGAEVAVVGVAVHEVKVR